MISVIIPVYNGEKYIRETIKSILSSTYRELQVIIVNDGSPDNSETIILELQKEDDRIEYYYKENGGIVSARNYGLERVRGEYVCFVDQDDLVKPYMYEILLKDIEKDSDIDMIEGGISRMINGVETGLCIEEHVRIIEQNTDLFHKIATGLITRLYSSNSLDIVRASIWNKLFRTSFLRANKIMFYKYLDYEDDWIFIINALRRARKICIQKKTVYCWHINDNSESHSRKKRDYYIADFSEKHKLFREFLIGSLDGVCTDERFLNRFREKLVKESMLWGLSNETGRGIYGRSYKDSLNEIKKVTRADNTKQLSLAGLLRPLPVSVYGHKGIRKVYYVSRDIFLTLLLEVHMEEAAILINKNILHGRWHV